MKSPGGGSRQILRSPSSFSRRRGFATVWDVVAELDCAERVRKTQTATSVTAIVTNVVLTEFEFIAHLLSWVARPDRITPIVHFRIQAHTMGGVNRRTKTLRNCARVTG